MKCMINGKPNTKRFKGGLIGYLGSKGKIIGKLLKLFALFQSSVFIDLCGGSGLVTLSYYYSVCHFAKRRIINEKSTELALIYLALSKYSDRLIEVMRTIEVSEASYTEARHFLQERANKYLKDYEEDTEDELIHAAALSWFVHHFSRTGSKISSKPYIDENKKRWENIITKDIYRFIEAFAGVEVWNLDARDALRKIRNEIKDECTVFIDPPYLSDKHSNVKTDPNTYKYNDSRRECFLKEAGHAQMLDLASKLPKNRFHVIVSNYENEVYDSKLATKAFRGWHKRFIEKIPSQCGSGTNSRNGQTAREFVYTNFGYIISNCKYWWVEESPRISFIYIGGLNKSKIIHFPLFRRSGMP